MVSPGSAGTGCSRRFVDRSEVILPLCPFPPLFWWCAASVDGASIDVHEHYPKRTFRNRFMLIQASGQMRWTVSVERRAGRPRSQQDTMRVTGDSDRKAWQAVRTAYGSAPYFTEMEGELEALFLAGPESLGGWNWATMEWMSEWLGVALPPAQETRLDVPEEHQLNMESWSRWWSDSRPSWPHVWEGRIDALDFAAMSGLDALLHLGPEAARFIDPIPLSGFQRPE